MLSTSGVVGVFSNPGEYWSVDLRRRNMDTQSCQNLDDGELWLPSDFLSGESPPKKRVMHKNNNINSNNRPRIPCEFPYEWNSLGHSLDSSSQNSPVESVVGSTETESDEEDDYIAGLAHRIAHSMLDDDENSLKNHELQWTAKSNTMARSPQSILSAVGSWSTGSSKGPSQVSSPPTTPLTESTDAWDLLYAAAGEVGRLNMDDVKQIPSTQGLVFGAASRQNISASQLPIYVNKDFQKRSCSYPGFPTKDRAYSSQALQRKSDKIKEEDKKLLAHHYRQPKQSSTSAWARQVKPTQVQHLQDRPVNKPGVGNRPVNPLAYSNTLWPPLQQSNGSGMRAVFLGPNGTGRESGGTGVFLPRRVGNSSDLRRKPSCSTVLLPSRVVQALNLNVEDLNAQTGLQCGIAHNYRDALTSTPSNPATAQYGKSVDQFKLTPRNGFSDQQNNICYPACPQIQAGQAEISLPQEWTY